MDEHIKTFLSEAGIKHITDVAPVVSTEGRNNRVYKICSGTGTFLLKQYFSHPCDKRKRLSAEFQFINFLRNNNISSVPSAVFADETMNMALYDFIDGRHITPDIIDDKMIEQVLHFAENINGLRESNGAENLQNASEACFSIEDHISLIGWRLDKLLSMNISSPADNDAIAFIGNRLLPLWEKTRPGIISKTKTHESRLSHGQRCLSPSDFGFHNSILRSNGKLCFIDFEYAGWDDPAKMICDLFLQPSIPLDKKYYSRFIDSISMVLQFPGLRDRCNLMIDAFKIKWCIILLNEFTKTDQDRRAFSNSMKNTEESKHSQLIKADSYINNNW